MIKVKFSLFVLTVFVGLSTPAQSQVNQLLQCLAKEETAFHQAKVQNALFRLNQEFINEFASSNDITIKNSYIRDICNDSTMSPSLALLKNLLLKEAEIYDLNFSRVESSLRPFKRGYVEEFQKQVPRLFFQYISGLQGEMPTHDCLEKYIPELTPLKEKLKYLEEELSTKSLITNKKDINAIFTKLKNIDEIKNKCLWDRQKRDREIKTIETKKV